MKILGYLAVAAGAAVLWATLVASSASSPPTETVAVCDPTNSTNCLQPTASGGVTGMVTGKVTVVPQTNSASAGVSNSIMTGGVAQLVTGMGTVDGCYLTNPLTAADQTISSTEILYVNPVTTATANGNGTNSALAPGQTYNCPPGMTNGLSAIAATSGHAFSLVVW